MNAMPWNKDAVRRKTVNGRTQVPWQICGRFCDHAIFHSKFWAFGYAQAVFLTRAEVLSETPCLYHPHVLVSL